MKISCLAAAAGLASLVFAGSALAGPSPSDKGLKLGTAMPVKRDPIKVRGVKLVDGKIVGTTEWKPYKGGSAADAPPSAYAFDAYESGLGVPTDGAAPDGNRYLFLWVAGGPFDYVSPVRLADFTMAPGFDNAQSQWADIIFMAGDQSDPGTNVDFFYALFTSEDMLTGACAWDETTYDGVQLGFGPGDGFFFSNVDLSTDPSLFWQLPADGVGSYLVLLTQDAGGTILADGQTGMWVTGEDVLPAPEPRPGTNEPQEAADESTAPTCGAANKAQNIPDGQIDLACECFSYLFNIPNVGTTLTSSLGFGAEGGDDCYADCDGDTVLTIDDFICFQTFFALSDPFADCDGDTVLTIDDFICFQTFFAIGCG